MGIAIAVLVAVWLLVAAFPESSEQRGGTLANPIDRRHLRQLDFGKRSHWLQPWRAYLDTPPATRLRDAIGINFNVEPGEADATARLLARSGFTRARVEFGWDSLDFRDRIRAPSRARIHTLLEALRRHGLRPLILLNANHGAPGPTRRFSAVLTEPAPAGAREVRLTRASARRIRPGLSGIDHPDGKAADVLFTRVARDGAAGLSKPLPRALAAGPQRSTTLRYPPFGPPLLADGRRNPLFERTMRGWLRYAEAIVREARAVLGSQDFDVEIWNEMSFGSDFLFQQRYYDPPREQGSGDVTDELLSRSVRVLRSLAPGIGIGDGFASQTPFPSGATSPPGLTAIDKHPYYGIQRFPADAVQDGSTPLDARGRPDYRSDRGDGGKVVRRDRFVPRYDAFFPEYILSAIQTETLIRDLAPITSSINGVPHGRRTAPPRGRPPEIWVTETNLDPTGADPRLPGRSGDQPLGTLTTRDVERLQAKATLRYLTAFVNKGASAVHMYAVKGANLALVSPGFFSALARSGEYPGEAAGGITPRAVGRLTRALRPARRLTRTRPLSLLSISDDHGHTQFEGDGTRRHPPLFDRDVVAFLPFELGRGRYVVATYVMTRNLARPYGDEESDPRRYDLPPARFRLAIGGLGSGPVDASASDPLTGERVPVEVRRRRGGGFVVELPLTDTPRLLSLRRR